MQYTFRAEVGREAGYAERKKGTIHLPQDIAALQQPNPAVTRVIVQANKANIAYFSAIIYFAISTLHFTGPYVLPIASASSVQYVNGCTYIIGDDSPFILVCEGEGYTRLRQIPVVDRPERRIPKPEKPDFESSVLVEDKLLLIGSASTALRQVLMLVPLHGTAPPQVFSSRVFIHRIAQLIPTEINIEAAVVLPAHGRLLLSLRGHVSNPANRLVITSAGFYRQQDTAPLKTARVDLPVSEFFTGISGFAYHAPTDRLYFTASTEQTTNAYDDGPIGDSYLGWIDAVSVKLLQQVIKPNAFYNVSQLYPPLKGQKLEGVCVHSANGAKVKLLLVADNDTGNTSNLYELLVQ